MKFDIDTIKTIVSVLSLAIWLITVILGLILKVVKKAGGTKAADAISKVLGLVNVIEDYIKEAEAIFEIGTTKKEWVMTKVQAYCLKNNIAFDEEAVSEKIDSLVALSKAVNYDSDKDEVNSSSK